MTTRPPLLRVALPTPLPGCFDYLAPPGGEVARGQRVRVPFGRRRLVGVVIGEGVAGEVPRERLKAVQEILDPSPLLDEGTLTLLEWAARYYHHPLGEVIDTALPVLLRQGRLATRPGSRCLRSTAAGRDADPGVLSRAPRQAMLLALLRDHPDGLGGESLDKAMPGWRAAARALVEKGLAETAWVAPPALISSSSAPTTRPELNPAQREAVDAVLAARGYGAFLLHGVTGSGKTEVYLRLAEEALVRGKQVLVLVPEIGLAPQIVERFRSRLATSVAVLHSGLAEGERLDAWLAAREGACGVLIGTRSAVLAPLARIGLVVVDEEHDASFKQQDGFRYSARDLAVVRAHREGVPVVLGSATPSLESLANCERGTWRLLRLPERAGEGSHPAMRLVDTRVQPLDEGLSPPLVAAIRRALDANGQVLLFVNRRGYAPILRCDHCGWQATCARCDARMTLHEAGRRLRCHHCGAARPAPLRCPECNEADGLRLLGQGTERAEDALARFFPDSGVVRIDRDSMRGRDKFERTLAAIHDGTHRILVGTQMLAKGHHFPEVRLAAILDADQGLFSPDFRGTERMAQLVMQVAGRAGREGASGEVVMQTRQPDHPLLKLLLERGYEGFAEAALEERRAIGMPPFASLALLRAESPDARAGQAFLEAAKRVLEEGGVRGVDILGPAPAPMERRAGKVRTQLLLRAANRADLQRLLTGYVEKLYGLREARRVRWSLDVDPQEMD